jgi:hypothetical protein
MATFGAGQGPDEMDRRNAAVSVLNFDFNVNFDTKWYGTTVELPRRWIKERQNRRNSGKR